MPLDWQRREILDMRGVTFSSSMKESSSTEWRGRVSLSCS